MKINLKSIRKLILEAINDTLSSLREFIHRDSLDTERDTERLAVILEKREEVSSQYFAEFISRLSEEEVKDYLRWIFKGERGSAYKGKGIYHADYFFMFASECHPLIQKQFSDKRLFSNLSIQIDSSTRNFENVTFSLSQFAHGIFSGSSSFVNCVFQNCYFHRSIFDEIVFYNCIFQDCSFEEAYFSARCSLKECKFRHCIFDGTSFDENISPELYSKTTFDHSNYNNETLFPAFMEETPEKYGFDNKWNLQRPYVERI